MIFTLEDIEYLPDNNGNWFYGLVKNHKTNKIGIYEIFPGMGYATIFPIWRPNMIYHLVINIITQLKHNNVLRLTDKEFNDRKAKRKSEIENAKPWNPDWLDG